MIYVVTRCCILFFSCLLCGPMESHDASSGSYQIRRHEGDAHKRRWKRYVKLMEAKGRSVSRDTLLTYSFERMARNLTDLANGLSCHQQDDLLGRAAFDHPISPDILATPCANHIATVRVFSGMLDSHYFSITSTFWDLNLVCNILLR